MKTIKVTVNNAVLIQLLIDQAQQSGYFKEVDAYNPGGIINFEGVANAVLNDLQIDLKKHTTTK